MNVFITGWNGALGGAISAAMIDQGHVVFGSSKGINNKPDMEAACAQQLLEGQKKRTHIDLLVLNDGINHLSHIGATPIDDGNIMDVNVMATYWALNWFMATESPPSKVVFIASQTHRVAQRTTALYCASKAAVVQMSRVAARELGPIGIQVNALCPGKIEDTKMALQTDAQVMDLRSWDRKHADEYAKKLIPMGRFTTKAEVAQAVMWLSQAPAYVHGAVIDMAGGV